MIDIASCGAGRIGKIHAANLVRQLGVRLKYVVDMHTPSVESVAKMHGAKVADADGVLGDLSISRFPSTWKRTGLQPSLSAVQRPSIDCHAGKAPRTLRHQCKPAHRRRALPQHDQRPQIRCDCVARDAVCSPDRCLDPLAKAPVRFEASFHADDAELVTRLADKHPCHARAFRAPALIALFLAETGGGATDSRSTRSV